MVGCETGGARRQSDGCRSAIAVRTVSGLSGAVAISRPLAAKTALATQAGPKIMLASATPLTPKA
jgi:hypothetical protein